MKDSESTNRLQADAYRAGIVLSVMLLSGLSFYSCVHVGNTLGTMGAVLTIVAVMFLARMAWIGVSFSTRWD